MSLLTELRRRNVFRVAALYAVAGWLLLQVADVLFGLMEVPAWGLRLVLGILVLGFPVALVLSWIYELTPEGVKRESAVPRDASVTDETGRKLSLVTTVLLALAVIMLVMNQFSLPDASQTRPAEPATASGEAGETTPLELQAGARPTPAATDRRSVAVLPFVSRSSREDDVFFADGMHDDLLTQLAKIASLKVISRTSVMEYRGSRKKIPEIARELGVANVLEGGVQRAGNRVRINVQLIDAGSDEHLWAETYDREITAENIFDIQSEMARMIAGALQATLSPEEEQRLQKPLTRDLPALEAFRRALWLREEVTPDELDRAEKELKFALQRDPEFAAAEALLAEVYLSRFWFSDTDPVDRERAWAAIQRGRALDPELAALDVAEGYYHYWGFLDYDAALKVLERAARAAPNDSRVIQLRAWVKRRAGQFEEAIVDLQRALELDPRNELTLGGLGETLGWLHRPDDGRTYLAQALELNPDSAYNRAQLGIIMIWSGELQGGAQMLADIEAFDVSVPWYRWWAAASLGEVDRALEYSDFGRQRVSKYAIYLPEMMRGLSLRFAGRLAESRKELGLARDELEKLQAASPGDFRYASALCITYGALGLAGQSSQQCHKALDSLPDDAWQRGYFLMDISWGPAMSGDKDLALELLASVLESPAGPSARMLSAFPAYEPLRDDPGFRTLMTAHGAEVPSAH